MWNIRKWKLTDIAQFCKIWNEIVESGNYYMGEEKLDESAMKTLCQVQTIVHCLVNEENIVGGFYILHPNQIGRGAHIANATYAVSEEFRGYGLGRRLVEDSIWQAKEHGFCGFQFNAVVSTNEVAVKLYEQLGFKTVGMVPETFRLKDGTFADLKIMFMDLKSKDCGVL